MAVLLVAAFPILLLISSPLAWGGVALGILLLYLDNRQQGLTLRGLPVSTVLLRRRARAGIQRVRRPRSSTPKSDDTPMSGPQAEAA